MDVEKVKLYNELTLDTLMHEIIIGIIFYVCLFVCLLFFYLLSSLWYKWHNIRKFLPCRQAGTRSEHKPINY